MVQNVLERAAPHRSLDDIADDVKSQVGIIRTGFTMTVEAMIMCGELLAEARPRFASISSWSEWTKDMCGLGHGAANTCMRVAENKERVLASGAVNRHEILRVIGMGPPLPPTKEEREKNERRWKLRQETVRLKREEANRRAMRGNSKSGCGVAYAHIRKALEACAAVSQAGVDDAFAKRSLDEAVRLLYICEDRVVEAIRRGAVQ